MITGDAVPAPRYTITGVSPRRHATTRDFAEALAYRLRVEKRRSGGPE